MDNENTLLTLWVRATLKHWHRQIAVNDWCGTQHFIDGKSEEPRAQFVFTVFHKMKKLRKVCEEGWGKFWET